MHWLRFGFAVVAFAAILVALGESGIQQRRLLAASLPNLGRGCFNVLDYGADPSGSSDSTTAFQAALLSASLQNGGAVCAPAGTYSITHLTLYNGATGSAQQGGPSLYGAGPGVTVLEATGNGNVFDSCPGYGNVSLPNYIPALCPSPLPSYGTATPYPNSLLSGVVLSNFSIAHPSPAPSGVPSSDFFFPYVQDLMIDNVCVSGSNNVFDLGEHTAASSFSSITIRDGTCGFSFNGHFLALHGNGSNLTIRNNTLTANGSGLALDTTDLTNGVAGSVSAMSWVGNVVEQPFLGMFAFAGGPTIGGVGSTITSSQWKGNVYSGCLIACYYVGLDSTVGGTLPLLGGLKFSDRSASSRYDAFYFDGGLVTASGGVQGVQVEGPSFYNGASGGTASSIIMFRGTPSPGDVWIVWGGTSHYASHYSITATSSDTPNSIASHLAALAGASPIAQQVNLANTGYGVMGVSLLATPAAGSYTAQPYQVMIASSGLTAIGLPTAPGGCIPPGGATPVPCWNGAFDVGDGVAIRNGAHDLDITGARIISQAGASIHVWPNGGDQLHFLNNVVGTNQGVNSFTGLQLDNGSSNPSNFYIAGNDFVGATNPIVNSIPTPSFVGSGAAAAVRANRGPYSYVVGPSTVSGVSSLTVPNSGPYDCIYYFKWTAVSGTLTQTLTLPGLGAASVNAEPWQLVLPVGATFTAATTGSFGATYTGFCQP